ncbi:paraquat-inducible protein B [Klebsiella michiganensis]|uniref:Paraquat-inducible protein B n=1 Tax=Klebsiella michiganensis TaxID=1134687 RepID=A0A7H4LW00_9ENTR|nr:paraquat-inducible protein B [Klebsiella michiganensis]
MKELAVWERCYPAPISNCSRVAKALFLRSIRCWIHRRWPPLMLKVFAFCWKAAKRGQLSPGDPVLFRGYRVGSVETSTFDAQKRNITYQLFISAPNDRLVTNNVRFWKDSVLRWI